jgi:hypothetical protein
MVQLRKTGERLPQALREKILALGQAAVRPLIALVEDPEAALETAPGGGWPPIHAVTLLTELGAVEAVEALLRALVLSNWMDILHDRILVHLPKLGAAVLEPALAALARTTTADVHRSLCAVLAALGVRDERVFRVLCDSFEQNRMLGAVNFGEYGDPAALPYLLGAIERFEPDFEHLNDATELASMVEAVEALGGALSPEVRSRLDGWFDRWEALGKAALPSELAHASHTAGRNEPCPCGSGKKYKKCCIDKPPPPPIPSAQSPGRGAAAQVVDYAKPLLDACDGSREAVQAALNIATLLWNLSVTRDNTEREAALAEMKLQLHEGARQDFERTARIMMRRHREMFPELHA